MKLTAQIAERFKEIMLNGEWVVGTNYQAQLTDINWKQATIKLNNLNSIAELVFHVDYYIAGILNVFENGELEIRDKYSFDMKPITSQEDWLKLLNKFFTDAEKLAQKLEQMPEEKLEEVFVEQKYGNYQRNINALIEHSFYHLGQIVFIKKMI